MEEDAGTLIDALGGTTKVSELTKAPPSTVHSWRTNCPPSRLEHLKLLKEREERRAAAGTDEQQAAA